jgi:Flp pilus assembly protein TadG
MSVMKKPRPAGHCRNLARDTKGTTVLEFGFVAMLLIWVIMGTMELGRILWLEHMVENAAKQGARYATVRGDDSDIMVTDAQIADYIAGRLTGISGGELTVDITWSPDKRRGSTVTVAIATTVEPLTAGFLLFKAYTIDGTASLIIAQ